jgi:hypothetical protein
VQTASAVLGERGEGGSALDERPVDVEGVDAKHARQRAAAAHELAQN